MRCAKNYPVHPSLSQCRSSWRQTCRPLLYDSMFFHVSSCRRNLCVKISFHLSSQHARASLAGRVSREPGSESVSDASSQRVLIQTALVTFTSQPSLFCVKARTDPLRRFACRPALGRLRSVLPLHTLARGLCCRRMKPKRTGETGEKIFVIIADR
jgi:hypothetical protein